MELLEQIKLLANITVDSKDTLVNLVIDKTKLEIAAITKVAYVTAMDNVLVDMVVVKLNRLGNEGINSISASGIGETYSDKYPVSILRQLDRLTKRVTLL